ncbi:MULTISPECIES: RidA family protein [Arthrobacter]|uniref:RidA family protein n=1 Tax=Arthrobacter terricola TaxID=2547396 RepID=A0A4R5KJF1_9MICC|nr:MULTISPECIES: RidA family protein [Arthrobacter]MBT8159230.1 RidA family protein [Arthrobacter sp. GN70]TDF94935.1 RidA family protein [Arthrobacter terricola]
MNEYIDAGLEAHWSGTLAEATGLPTPPFAPLVRTSGTTLYLSGQTFPVIGSGDQRPAVEVSLEEQTQACLTNIDNLVRAGGAHRNDIVKVTIYNTRMDQQSVVNSVYAQFFGDHRPTRTHVEVSRLADPDLLIEIEAIAVVC